MIVCEVHVSGNKVKCEFLWVVFNNSLVDFSLL